MANLAAVLFATLVVVVVIVAQRAISGARFDRALRSYVELPVVLVHDRDERGRQEPRESRSA